MSDFTNRELEMMFKGITEKMDDHYTENNKVNAKILAQVITTNGRVRSLEQWRWGLAGGLSVVTSLVIFILIPLGFKLLEMWGGR